VAVIQKQWLVLIAITLVPTLSVVAFSLFILLITPHIAGFIAYGIGGALAIAAGVLIVIALIILSVWSQAALLIAIDRSTENLGIVGAFRQAWSKTANLFGLVFFQP